jgi:ketosteroid isomerase-like protein
LSGVAGKLASVPRRAPEIEELIRDWLDDKQAARTDGIARRLADYDGALAIGTGPDEWFIGGAAFRSGHTSGGPFTATIEAVEAHREGDAAWAAVRAVIDTGEPDGFPIRLSLVLIARDDGWQIVHSHASTPGPA